MSQEKLSPKELENIDTVPGTNDSPEFDVVVDKALLDRRDVLKGVLAGATVATAALATPANAQTATTGLNFTPITLTRGNDFVDVPPGYDVGLVIAWGNPLFPNAPEFDINRQNGETQSMQFGYNCDMIAYFSADGWNTNNSRQGILAINHEYTNGPEMFPGYVAGSPTKEQVDAELAAHGVSVVEVRERFRTWEYLTTSEYNRRITATTPMEITGPAAGDDLMKTSADPTGTRVLGTLNNCAGGQTPWGTYLTAEENFNQYFANRNGMPDGVAKTAHARYGLPTGPSGRRWENFYDRFDLTKEPNEPFRHGWVVEIDPYNPTATPKKRTALGRSKHECATTILAPNGQVVVYSGDDERFDYVYKFVTNGIFNPDNRAANMDLLDNGVRYVAKFNADGTGEWLPLIHGQGPLTTANGWRNQADVCIRGRQAGDALGATKMDRPEDVEVNPVTGVVYIACTNNSRRAVGTNPGTDAANPRPDNRWGHIIEIMEEGNDHTRTTFRWGIFMLCGDPDNAAHGAFFAGAPREKVAPIAAPDNVTFDNQGNLWIGTDGMGSPLGWNDAIYAAITEGPERGTLMPFLQVPIGAETCGPTLTPDNETFFLAIQHPGEGGTFAEPRSRWPYGGNPRPGVIFVKKSWGRGPIGS
ncbi:MAG: PhoX family phosphatase [Bryobacter sp.]|nr:PhoX family phosphatase [Bryobacter sp.]